MRGINHYPVSKDTLIDMSDYNRMRTESHTSPVPVPPWALDNEKVRKVVAYRIAITAKETNVPTTLDGLRQLEPRYIAMLRNSVGSPEVQLHLEKVTRFGGPAAYYTGLIYRRFRLGMSSSALAQHYGSKATAVRQAINRLSRIARVLFPNPQDHLQWHHSASNRDLPQLKFKRSRTFSYEQAYALWLSGLSFPDISKQMGVAKHLILAAVRKMRKKEPRRPNTKIDIAKARRLRNQGHTLQYIAAKFGLRTRTAVMLALRKWENRNAIR